MNNNLYNKKPFHILNFICGILVFIASIFLLVIDIVFLVIIDVIIPFIVFLLLVIFFFFLSYNYYLVIKTKLKDLTKNQLRLINSISLTAFIIFGLAFVSMLCVIISCLFFGPLEAKIVIYSFAGIGLFSLLMSVDNYLIRFHK